MLLLFPARSLAWQLLLSGEGDPIPVPLLCLPVPPFQLSHCLKKLECCPQGLLGLPHALMMALLFRFSKHVREKVTTGTFQ